MGASQPLHVAMLVIILCLLGADNAEGYTLYSAHFHLWHKDAMPQPSQPVLKLPSIQQLQRKKDPAKEQEYGEGSSALSEKELAEIIPKYPVIEACHLRLQMVFGKLTETWYMDWKLWVGLTLWLSMWAKWLRSGFDEIYWQWAIFAFGVDVLILHILQYASSILSGLIVICSMLSGQALLQTYMVNKRELSLELDEAEEAASDMISRMTSMTAVPSFSTDLEDSDDLEEFECDTLYLDIGLPIEQILILFVGQVGVWCFYMTSILHSIDFAEVNYLFWFWSYLVMQMTMIFCRGSESALGNAFPIHDVHRMIKVADKVKFRLHIEDCVDDCESEKKAKRDAADKAPSFQIRPANIILRGVMGFFCNCILREIMAYTIPLMLMGFSEPMDFVVYCVGVNFICTLDDMSDRKYQMIPLSDQSEESSID